MRISDWSSDVCSSDLMRLADVEDFVRRAGLDEFVQHLAAVELRVLDLTVELAVAEQAGAAFTELHVRRRVQHALAPQAPGILGALAHRLAAFEAIGRASGRERGCQ